MAQQHRIGTHRTTVAHVNGALVVTYHETPVVTVTREMITLDTGGFETATTKTRMNQASNQFDLGFKVFQKNFNWFVKFKDRIQQFHTDIIELSRT